MSKEVIENELLEYTKEIIDFNKKMNETESFDYESIGMTPVDRDKEQNISKYYVNYSMKK